MIFYIPLNTSTFFYKYRKLPAPSTRSPYGLTDLRSIYVHARFSLTSIKMNLLPWVSMEVDLRPHKFPWKLSEVDFLPWTLVEASMAVHGCPHCRCKRTHRFGSSFADSTNIFRGSFHKLPYSPTHVHPLPRVSQPFSCIHKINLNANPKLKLSPWKLLPTSLEADGSTRKLFASSKESRAP